MSHGMLLFILSFDSCMAVVGAGDEADAYVSQTPSSTNPSGQVLFFLA